MVNFVVPNDEEKASGRSQECPRVWQPLASIEALVKINPSEHLT